MVNPDDPAAEDRLWRPLMKSALRLPWAMTLWGAQQAANLALPGRTGRRTVSAFDAMGRTASEHMGDTAKSVYRTGEHLQGGVIDAANDLASRKWKSESVIGGAWEALVHPWTRKSRDGETEETS